MSFQKNEIIVRDDGKYPDGALVVDGYDASGALLAHPFGGGFQLIIPPSDHSGFAVVPEEERTPIFTRTKFSFEGLEESFTGWTDGKNWNGWAMPRFEFADAQRLIAALAQDGGKYDPGADAFITMMEASEPENWCAEIIDLPDGGTVKVYPIGAGSWIWEEADSP
jgi:hypothetical protein